MNFVYGILGWVAKTGASLSRTRLNLIPGNWLLIGSCAMVAALGWGWSKDALGASSTPQKATVAQVWQGASHQRYLTVTGEIHPEQSVTVKGEYTNNTLAPMIDRVSGKAFFADIPAGSVGTAPRIVTLTGTTHSLSSSVHGTLNARFNTGVIKYNPYIFLDAGGKPESPVISIVVMLVCGLFAALYFATASLQHTVFRRTGKSGAPKNAVANATIPAANSSFSASTATQTAISSTRLDGESSAALPISGAINDLRLTGKLRLHEKAAQRFIDVPASRLRLEDGSYAFASNIDASTRTYGVVTTKRVGLWLLMPNLRAVQWEEGNLYNGFRPRPALRLNFNDALDKDKKSTAIFSFADAVSRAQLIAELQAEIARTA